MYGIDASELTENLTKKCGSSEGALDYFIENTTLNIYIPSQNSNEAHSPHYGKGSTI